MDAPHSPPHILDKIWATHPPHPDFQSCAAMLKPYEMFNSFLSNFYQGGYNQSLFKMLARAKSWDSGFSNKKVNGDSFVRSKFNSFENK